MDILKQYRKHIICIFLLILAAGLAEGIITIYYDRLIQNPPAVGRIFSIRPVYNENGSWYHARLGIGYIRALLIVENIVTLLIAWFIYRFLDIWGWFFDMHSFWLYLFDFVLAPTLYRLVHNILGIYTLDYIRIAGKRSASTFDFPDFYLGIAVIWMFVWFVFALLPYYRYKHIQVRGMRYLSKLAWEFRIAALFVKGVFIPKERWAELFENAGFGR